MSTSLPTAPSRLLLDYAHALWNDHDLSAIEMYSRPEGVVHEFGEASQLMPLPVLRQRVARILSLMPDHRMEVVDLLHSGESVFWSWEVNGTWSSLDTGVRPISFRGASVYHYRDGLIWKRSGDSDALGLDYQLGRTSRRVTLAFPL